MKDMNEENEVVSIISDNAQTSPSVCQAILCGLTTFLNRQRHELSAERIAQLEAHIAEYAERSKPSSEPRTQ
jgi:hypothetical protein